MKQQIVIPWRSIDCIYREKHFNYLVSYYSKYYDIIIGDNDGDFNRSAARNSGVDKCESEVVVVIDADNYIPINQIENAIRSAKRSNFLVKPFNWFGYLTEPSTDLFYEFNGLLDFVPEFVDPPQQDFTGGAYVIKKVLWKDIGGMDEGFVGWGAEDDAFHLLCINSGIRVKYVEGYDYHLYHPAHRVTSEYNYNKLMKEYVDGNKSSRIKAMGR